MNKLTIVKIGGKIINDGNLLRDFLQAFSAIEGMKILVHGGGRTATEMLGRLGIRPEMVDGRRVTDNATLDVCIGQYAGVINKRIVALLQSMGVDALGLSGADGALISAEKRSPAPVDYGFAGDIVDVDDKKIMGLMQLGLVPVFCAVTADRKGQLLNTNADTISSALAIALAGTWSVDLKYCFEYDGILLDLESKEVLKEVKVDSLEKWVKQKILQGGVIPKVYNAVSARKNGVSSVSICGIGNLHTLHNATQIII